MTYGLGLGLVKIFFAELGLALGLGLIIKAKFATLSKRQFKSRYSHSYQKKTARIV